MDPQQARHAVSGGDAGKGFWPDFVRDCQRVAAKSLQQNPAGAVLALAFFLTVAVGFGGVVAVQGVVTGIEHGVRGLGADLVVLPTVWEDRAKAALLAGTPSTFTMQAGVLDRIRQTNGVRRASPQLFMKPSLYQCCSTAESFLVAFDPETDFTILPWLRQNSGSPPGQGEAVVGSAVLLPAGVEFSFYGTALLVVGALQETGGKFIDNGIFMSFASARRMIRDSAARAEKPLEIAADGISVVLVQVDQDQDPAHIKASVKKNVEGVTAVTLMDLSDAAARRLSSLKTGLALVVFFFSCTVFVLYCLVFSRQLRRVGGVLPMDAVGDHGGPVLAAAAVVFCIALAAGALGIFAGVAGIFFFKDALGVFFDLPCVWPQGEFIAAAAAGFFSLILVIPGAAFLCAVMTHKYRMSCASRATGRG